MKFFRKVASAFTAAPRLVGTVLNPNKKVSDFKVFDSQPIKETISDYTTGMIGAGGAALGVKVVKDKQQTAQQASQDGNDLGNLFGSTSLDGILKSQNLLGSGIDVKKLLGIGQGNTPVGGSFEFGTQGSRNLFLPFAIIVGIILTVFALRPKKRRR